jgi:hypothetical protein
VWRRQAARNPERAGLFVLPLSPDRVHKENVSGGAPYGFILPDGCADGLFAGETTMPFVSYLNHVFSHGGFPARHCHITTGSESEPSPTTSCPFDSRTQPGTEVTASSRRRPVTGISAMSVRPGQGSCT